MSAKGWKKSTGEPTEEECAAVRAWLAWLSQAKARSKQKAAAKK